MGQYYSKVIQQGDPYSVVELIPMTPTDVPPRPRPQPPDKPPVDPDTPHPSHPIALPGDPWWPGDPIDPPGGETPPTDPGVNREAKWMYSQEKGWTYVVVYSTQGGKPRPLPPQ